METTDYTELIDYQNLPLECRLEVAQNRCLVLENENLTCIETWKSKEDYLLLERDRLAQENHSLHSKNTELECLVTNIKDELNYQQSYLDTQITTQKNKLEMQFNLKNNTFQEKEKGYLYEIERISLELSFAKKQVYRKSTIYLRS